MDIQSYWNKFYKEICDDKYQTVPSQFAIFVLNELITNNITSLVEYGCGTGKDAIFFSSNDIRVYAYDSSTSAIEFARRRSEKLGQPVTFNHIADFSETKPLVRKNNDRICIYTRFFIHALDNNSIIAFLNHLESTYNKGDILMSEFRITGDDDGFRETEDHFRNFIMPEILINKLESKGFSMQYSISGTGMAKFKRDDALVMRIIAIKI